MSPDSITQARWPFLRSLVRPLKALRLAPVERKYLLLLVDLILVNGALLAALAIWAGFEPSLQAVLRAAKWFLTLSAVWLVTATVLDVYNLARASSTTNILASIGLAALSCVFVYHSIPWLTPSPGTRSYVLAFTMLMTLSLLAWRFVYARALVRPVFHRRALVLGTPASAWSLIHELKEAGKIQDANPFRGSGYEIVGLVSDQVSEGKEAPEALDEMTSQTGAPLLGDVRQLAQLAQCYSVDEVILASEPGEGTTPEVHEALLDCREAGLQISTLTDVYERLTARLPAYFTRQNTQLLLSPADNPGYRGYVALKRLMDIALALVGLLALGLAIPVVALVNALTSPGPLFYRQERVGKGGRPFVMTKFRSMVPDAEGQTGAVWSGGDGDDRITPLGRWMRKARLDELPQVINVLRGEMSIVGPRPERPCFVQELCGNLPLYRARHAVKPGLTGWAQVRYRYGNSVDDAQVKLEYDLYYVKHNGLFLDLLIVLQTPRVVLTLRGE